MSTFKGKSPKDKSTIIMCKNCHQDILEDKMFLHEGFCLRNNVYCEHCEKVFLKKDYEDHVKNIPKNLSKKKSDSQSQSQKSPETHSESGKPNSTTEHNDSMNNFNDNIESLYPTPSLEFVQMPPTELFHINNPIIIAENGQIVSNKNKNEFLLPYLGINAFQPSQKGEEVLEGIINQGEIFKENNSISRNSYKVEELEKLLRKDSINSENSSNKIKTHLNIRESNSSNYSNDQIYNKKNIRLSERINEFNENKNNKSKGFINNVNYTDTNIVENNPINDNIDNEKELKNNIIINNNIITYNSNKNISKINNYFKNKETPKKPKMTNSLRNTNLNNNALEGIPLDKNSIKSHHIQTNNNNDFDIYFGNNFSGNKEPKDSNSKRSQIYQSSGQKNQKNTSFMPQSENGNGKIPIKRCEYCNNVFNPNEINIHYKICKMKKEKKKKIKKFDIPKPKKREETFLTENIPLENIDENNGLDNAKRATLQRKFNAALNVISLNNERKINRGLISNPDKNSKNVNIIKDNKKVSLKKKLFHLNNENIEDQNFTKKDFPEDSSRIEKAARTQKRIYRVKRINNLSVDGNNNIDFINNYIKNIKLQRSPKQQMQYNVYNTDIDPWHYFYDNFNINKH